MEAKHTPGPWFAVDYAGSICIQNGPMYEDVDLLCYDSIFSDTPVRYKEEVEANAKLMAAAPDLLKYLIEADQFINVNKSNMTQSKYHDMLVGIKEAIKKATE